MARTVKNANLQTRSARLRLRLGRTHWCSLRPGSLHLGYVRSNRDKPGIWTVRRYLGNVSTMARGPRGGRTPYSVQRLPGVADDYEDANGGAVLSFAQAQDAVLAPPVAAAAAGPLTVAGAAAAYVDYLRHEGRDGAAATAECHLRAYVRPLAHLRVDELTPELMRGWLHALANRLARKRADDDEDAVRRSRVSANRVLATLRAMLNHAYREGRVQSDAAWSKRVRPFKNVAQARLRYLTVEEARRLISAAQGPFRALVQAALATGARYGELARLRVHDFDPDSGTVGIGRSKSGQGRRVHLTKEGEQLIARLAAGRPGGALLLPRPDGDTWMRSASQHHMREAVTAARIDPPITFHGLRHTYASLSIMNGVPLQVVARNLGHVDTRMVDRYYGHLAASFQRDAIRAGAPQFGVVEDDGVLTTLRRRAR